MDIKESIRKAVEGIDLTEEEARLSMEIIMNGEATPAQIGAFLTALRVKGETVGEITGFARTMRAKVTRLRTRHDNFVDTCGTGGDGSNTFNISTTTAFVVAGAGVPVAKHGNRSVSSRCGSADLLESLGVEVGLTPDQVQVCLDEIGIGFLFAPSFHGAMKHAAGPRREIGIRTVFNILGPLTNPAGAPAQVLGVYDPKLTEVMARVLGALGSRCAYVIHGAGGMDEASHAGETKVSRLSGGQVVTYYIKPEDAGISRGRQQDLLGGSAADNAGITREILRGEQGPRRDVVLLNAALALMAAGVTSSLTEAKEIAAAALDSGAALNKLDSLIKMSRSLAQDARANSQS
ncbi:MAG: anthranilate phosphoribosyltransferase [Bacillota bacterium]